MAIALHSSFPGGGATRSFTQRSVSRQPGPSASFASSSRTNGGQEARVLENQNDVRMEELASKVSALHKVTIDIHDEVQDQHGLLDQTDRTMGVFGGRLQSTTRRFQTVMAQASTRQTCYLILGLLLGLWVIFYLFRMMRQSPEV
ncbi:hypothetical protein H4R33_001895 [Dimargaris cristalligena]|uniref:t-SNARE coiled-coil homology domain-containing protein n=1 Tax=Dimargaris cristalligena TaxID=215637 RepID=A0A4P9ZTG0_9FUNG|nr:hypothetical protein H4R33_001895 [Dimargaris cristalligena]RKP36032.1 hypothetical protein BJ085DRAFT_35780 [Dimargaris cristalligena]|eukprot:RKP36032.1 hypothetical protein BJ085DRAFT_35780 [Dimargaris cristalligena]